MPSQKLLPRHGLGGLVEKKRGGDESPRTAHSQGDPGDRLLLRDREERHVHELAGCPCLHRIESQPPDLPSVSRRTGQVYLVGVELAVRLHREPHLLFRRESWLFRRFPEQFSDLVFGPVSSPNINLRSVLGIPEPLRPLFVGVHPEYQRRQDVEIQTRLVRPEVPVVYGLADLAGCVKWWLPSFGWRR